MTAKAEMTATQAERTTGTAEMRRQQELRQQQEELTALKAERTTGLAWFM